MTSRIAAFIALVWVTGLLGACHREDHVRPLSPLSVPFESSIHDSLIAATIEYAGRVDTLSAAEFDSNIERLKSLFPEVMADQARSKPIRQEMVRQYVLEHLMMSEARRRGLVADSASVEAALEEFKSKFQTPDDYRKELQDIQQTEDNLRSQFRSSLTRDALIQSIEDSLPPISKSEVEAFRKSMSTRLRVQHILISVPDNPTPEALKASRKRADDLIDSLDAGKSFSTLAREYSDDPGSKVSGGELPWFRKGEMVPEFEEAAFRLKKQGDYTRKPVRTPYGYHVIRLLERKDDDVITPDSARALLVKRRVRTANEELQRRLVEQSKVRTNPAFIPETAPLQVQAGD